VQLKGIAAPNIKDVEGLVVDTQEVV
jgi:hypothetical protein